MLPKPHLHVLMGGARSGSSSNKLGVVMDEVEDVVIDDDGVFKYILIELKDKGGRKKSIVRGFEWAEYHGK